MGKGIRVLLWALAIVLAFVAGVGIWFWQRPVSFFNAHLYLQMWLGGARSHYVVAGGHRLHYYEEGEGNGPVVVLVHGLGGRSEDWRNLSVYLKNAGYHIYLPDLPGYGQSEKPANFSYSVPDEADAVVAFLDAVGLKQIDLGGISMGGGIVQFVAIRHPERIRKLMLFDAVGIDELPTWDVRLFTPGTPHELDELEALLMPNPPQVPPFIARDVIRISAENGWVIQRAMATMITRKDATEKYLPDLKLPTLVVWGDQDRVFPISQGQKMHQLIPDSHFQVAAGCGHLAPIQCADQIAPGVIAFLKQ